MEVLGIRMVGLNAENGQKVLLTIVTFALIYLAKLIISRFLNFLYRHHEKRIIRFWSKQGLNLLSAGLLVLTFLSIWFDDPTRLATGLGLVTAGLAFALQKVVTSFAGYLIIMRGNTFNVGERITMGGIRGDVISLGFLQTTILEMGQPPSVQGADPAMWIKSRQFTGRVVTVTNDKVFETPVYNYTRDFPFIWEEMSIPVKYTANRKRVEQILVEAVNKNINNVQELGHEVLKQLEQKYDIQIQDIVPKVFYRLTDNWLELTVRFIVPDRGVRDIKSDISRDIIEAFDQEKIEIASATFEVVGVPPIQFNSAPVKNVQAS